MMEKPDDAAATSWRDLAAGAPQYLMLLDDALRFVYVNKLRPGRGDPTGRSVFEFLPASYHPTLQRALDAARGSGYPQYFELEAAGPGGETSWYSNWVVPMHGPGAERLAIIAEDVTDQFRTEQALETEKGLFRSLVANAPDHVMIVDREHRAVFVNRAEPGWDIEDIIGRVADDMVPKEYRQRVHDAIEQVFATGKPCAFETQTPLADGMHWWSVRAGPVLEGERVDRVSLVSRDVTERVMRERAREEQQRLLQQSEERFRTLMEYAPEAVVILDADTGHFVEVNDNACRLFGRSRAELLQSGPIPLSPERQPDGSLSTLAALSRVQDAVDGKHAVFEWLHLDSSGAEILCEVRLVLLPSQGHRLVRGSILDITARKQAEAERQRLTAELAQAQKLQAIGQLTGGVAHDFNNLLTVIMSSVEMIQAMPEAGEVIRNHAHQALTASARAAALTQRLLAFARRQPLRPQVVDMNRLVMETETLLRRTLGETISVDISLGDGLWSCETDPTQLENVILNLAINARDAMPDGGRLIIETANASLDAEYTRQHGDVQPGSYVMLAVSDEGTGMDEAVLSQVFEPFFTTKRNGQGSGLGLSMVYGFVKQSKGHVNISSAVGVGTTVRVYLPKSHATPRLAVAAAEPQPAEPVGSGQRVLVVEDEPAVRALVVKGLQSLGYQTVDAPDARTAMAVISGAARVDLLLTDVVLPGGQNGPELARRIQALHPALPVLFMSGYAEHAMTQDGRVAADVALLEKPFTRQQLAAAVRAAIGHPESHASP